MDKFSVNLKGFSELEEKLKTLPVRVTKEVDIELGETAKEIQAQAVKDAPGDQGFLRGEIVAERVGDLQWKVVSGALYSAYVEFGTRSNVVIPPGLQSDEVLHAATSSLSAKEAIFLWCKRKGIDKKLWYPIFIKIMTEGIKPHPFFFKQREPAEVRLLARVNNIINAEHS